jgi:hypothetical protein
MKKLSLVLIFVTLSSLGFAQLSATGEALATPKSQFPVSFAQHTLKQTYIVSAFSGVSFTGGNYTAIDAPHKVLCPGTTGSCLIQADSWVQFGGNGTSDNATRISLFVDGIEVETYLAGELPTGFYYGNLSNSSGITVPFGTHTIQTFAWSVGGGGGTVGYYNLAYRIYKP